MKFPVKNNSERLINLFQFHCIDLTNLNVITRSISTEKEYKLCNFEVLLF
jgi:hypothetical protein